ncbi:MAG: hypothetical protein AAF628_08345 [Planctomycetota bacterium]
MDEELREANARYDRAVTRNEAEAGWLESVADFEQRIQELDLGSVEPEQQADALNASLDELYREQYEGLDDPVMAETLAPLMEQYRQRKLGELLTEQRRAAQERIDADLQTVARGLAETALGEAESRAEPGTPPHEISAAGDFDYLGLHERVRALHPGRETNERYFAILKDIAIRTGDPDLIRSLPDRWADGTPSIKAIPAFNGRILNAERIAESNRAASAKQYEAAVDDALKTARAGLKRQIALDMLDNTQDPADGIAQLAALGGTSEELLALESAWRAIRDDSEERATDPQLVASLTRDAYLNELSYDDVLVDLAQGNLPPGQEGLTVARQLMDVIEQSARTADRQADQRVSVYKQDIKGRYVASSGVPGIPPDLRKLRLQVEALAMFHQRTLEGGEDPRAAWEATRQEFDRQFDLLNGLDTSGPADPKRMAVGFSEGTISADAILQSRLEPAAFEQLWRDGEISEQQAEAVLAIYE